jgi:hypothetical protein
LCCTYSRAFFKQSKCIKHAGLPRPWHAASSDQQNHTAPE